MFNPQPDPPGLQLTIAGQVPVDDPDIRPVIRSSGPAPTS
jgi:hypothetical protein